MILLLRVQRQVWLFQMTASRVFIVVPSLHRMRKRWLTTETGLATV